MPPTTALALSAPPDERAHPHGEGTLFAALSRHRTSTAVAPSAAFSSSTRARLGQALHRGDPSAAESALSALWRHVGLTGAHDVLACCLEDVGRRPDATVADEHRAFSTASSALELLRASSPPAPGPHPVVLATPAGDRHTLALTALAHQLQVAGRGSFAVDDLPDEELRALVAAGQVSAVVISAHLPVSPAAVRRTVTAVRSVSPGTPVVYGGPGVPVGARGPSLVTTDPTELLALLGTSCAVLTSREREVLVAVADGLTNGEIAAALCLSPATVKSHLDHVLAKTGTAHRAAAVARALRMGWIT